MNDHSVEKIGGSSMSDFSAVLNNIILQPENKDSLYGRVFVVSAYKGITNQLLEHKKNGLPGIFALFSSGKEDDSWVEAMDMLGNNMKAINARLLTDASRLRAANNFIEERLANAFDCLKGLQSLCAHGHFSVEAHLSTVREMLASLGEAHSAWNTSALLQREGINASFVDLTGWNSDKHLTLDDRITQAFKNIDINTQLPIVTGYAHCKEGLMTSFDRGYSEMTFSRIAVLTQAREAVIHKEFHLSSADPGLVGEQNAVPIGRTNYDVADQLANLGMEAIHPKAAKGLRQHNIPLRVKNTFEPEHAGTLIEQEYTSEKPRVEIIAGRKGLYALEVFEQNMAGNIHDYDKRILETLGRFRAHIVSKDVNANTITHYLATNIKTLKRIRQALELQFTDAEISQQKVALVSAIGSDLNIPGMLAKTVSAIAESQVSVLAIHQSMRQVDMQFIVNENEYETAVKALHASLIEAHDHGSAICLAS